MGSPDPTPGVSTPVLVLTGPTAVGKSSLALALAEATGATILSADSRQVYRGMAVGTAAPAPGEKARVPHRFVGSLDVPTPYSAGQHYDNCRNAITDLGASDQPALVVGGSTLYVHALIRGIADLPALDPDLQGRLQREASTAEGRSSLYAELHDADPESARTLDPTKSQRLVRLVGLLRQTGRPPSTLWSEGHRPALPHRLIVLDRPRAELYRRIEARVDAMFEGGLVDETRALLASHPDARPLLDATIGYREVAAMLDGDLARPDAVRLVKRNTRRYAKRQLTWLRRYDEAVWLDARTATVDDVLEAAAPWPSRT